MKQVLQDLKTGSVIVADVPEPAPARGRLLVRVEASLLSAGTEGAQLAKGRQSLLAKVREKPQLIRQGLEELRERGLAGVKERLASKFEGYAELGYSCAGTVVHCGDENGSIAPGTLVACAGAGVANHAELVTVPMLLTAAAPAGVSAESAAYTTLGAIAMQGVRQAGVQLGEYVAVIGLGLVGLLTAQLLRAMGCRVAGIDPSAKARQRGPAAGCDFVFSPEQALEGMLDLSKGEGADAIIICAATPESSPVELAGKLARSRGRVVMVGATGMTIPRQEYYLKELSFTLSRSYGPGRYDRGYEEEGHDYPVDYVRFTEQRNMRAFLELVEKGRVDTACLTTHRFPVEEAPAAYALLNDRSVDRAGILLTYVSATPSAPARFAIQVSASKPVTSDAVGVGFLGAGAYAQNMLLPLLQRRGGTVLRCVMTRNGSHALHAARRFGFEKVCTRAEDVLGDPAVQLVFIATRHDSHAELTCQALRAGKHVWVEKPLALSLEELKAVRQALHSNPACRLVVGFNRPFSRSATWLLNKLGTSSPRMMLYRVNAGFVPPDSWIHDPQIGGGRLLGEGCHFFDFLRHVAGAEAESVHTEGPADGRADLQATGNFATTVRFSNGSVGQVLYSSQGSVRMGKERFECFTGQMCGTIDDYRTADFYHRDNHEHCSRHRQDKGQAALLDSFLDCLCQGTPPPMRAEDILESSMLTLAAQQGLELRQPVRLGDLRQQIL
jgi:predicted dehydrogenase/threonine dehydrogenase-like Zn-dependent dehydrogenase